MQWHLCEWRVGVGGGREGCSRNGGSMDAAARRRVSQH